MTATPTVSARVTQHIALVDRAIHAMNVPPHADFAALKSAGMAGLHEAAKVYSPARCEFETFAYTVVRRRIFDAIREAGTHTRRGFVIKKRLDAADAELTQSLGHAPNDRELADFLEISESELAKIRRTATSNATLSIDDEVSEGGLATFHDIIPEVEGALEREDAATVLGYVMQALDMLADKTERGILTKSYFHGTPLAKIGTEYGVTESRICQIRQRALANLRKHFTAIVRRDGQSSFTLPTHGRARE